MVSSVSSVPYSYLNQLLGASTAANPASSASSGSGSSVASLLSSGTSSGSGSSTASSLVSSLLSGGTSSGSYSSEVLSLLQENSSGSFDPITSLLGGTSTNNGLTSIYSNLFASSLAATLQLAQTNGTADAATATATPAPATASSGSGAASASATTDPVQALINSYTQASISYNNTIQQNAQSVIDANSYNADGTSLVG